MNRRDFMRAVSAGAAIVAGSTACSAGANYDTAALARTDLVAVLGSDVVRSIGTSYRAMNPTEADVRSLHKAILASRPWASRFRLSPSPNVTELVQSDFEHSQTVVVRGWVLSATEARQCALYSLLPG